MPYLQVRLRELGKLYPYNKMLPIVFAPEFVNDMHKFYLDLPIKGERTEMPHARVRELNTFQRLLFIR